MRAILCVLVFLLSSCGQPKEFYVPPAAGDVIEITVGFIDFDAATRTVIENVATKEQAAELLQCLSTGYRDDQPAKWRVLGDLIIKTSAEEIPVSLYFAGGKIGAFSIYGNYYRGCSDAEFERLLRSVAKNGVIPE